MVKLSTPNVKLGWIAESFNLTGIDGKIYNLDEIKGKKGTLIMFICNHCPYVKEIITDLILDIKKLKEHDVNAIAIMSNDTESYQEDSFDNMKIFSNENKFCFPYVIDKTQSVARNYDAVCTPDFFGFNENLELQYRGCFINKKTGNHDLLNAMLEISKTGKTTIEQMPSMGCSIKWKLT
jgi:peroxiredoxin